MIKVCLKIHNCPIIWYGGGTKHVVPYIYTYRWFTLWHRFINVRVPQDTKEKPYSCWELNCFCLYLPMLGFCVYEIGHSNWMIPLPGIVRLAEGRFISRGSYKLLLQGFFFEWMHRFSCTLGRCDMYCSRTPNRLPSLSCMSWAGIVVLYGNQCAIFSSFPFLVYVMNRCWMFRPKSPRSNKGNKRAHDHHEKYDRINSSKVHGFPAQENQLQKHETMNQQHAPMS
jgi:hypothetical protein